VSASHLGNFDDTGSYKFPAIFDAASYTADPIDTIEPFDHELYRVRSNRSFSDRLFRHSTNIRCVQPLRLVTFSKARQFRGWIAIKIKTGSRAG
jgi:hypothetical protein